MERLREPGAPGTPEASAKRVRKEARSLTAVQSGGGPTQVEIEIKTNFDFTVIQ